MKKADLTTGTLLAYRQPRTENPPAPAIMLDTTTLWEKSHFHGKKATWSFSSETRPGHRRGYHPRARLADWGYLTVIAETSYDTDKRERNAEALAQWINEAGDLRNLTPDAIPALVESLPKGARMDVIDNRYIAGFWEPVASEYDRKQAAEEAERNHRITERDRLTAVYDRASAAWRERFGFEAYFVWDSYTSDPLNARVSLDQLAELLGERTTEQ